MSTANNDEFVEREPFGPIDRLVRAMRTRTIRRFIPDGSRVLDVGCGQVNALIESSPNWHPDSLGIDPSLRDAHVGHRGRRVTSHDIAAEQPGSFDAAVSLAVIEHIPIDMVAGYVESMVACVKPGGVLVLTTPTPRAKPVLELMAYRLHVITEEEIRDHKQYFSRDRFVEAITAADTTDVAHRFFQLGFNQRIVARRHP